MTYDRTKLCARLQCILDMISECECVVDIGTDHAYIPIAALERGIAKSAVASDINDGPLEIATRNIEEAGLNDKISTIKSAGFENIELSGNYSCVIAGMGGNTIIQILSDDYAKTLNVELILQPMNAVVELRQWLYAKGFEFIKERIAVDDNKFYHVIKVSRKLEKAVVNLMDAGEVEVVARGCCGEQKLDSLSARIGVNMHIDDNYTKFLKNELSLIAKIIDGKKSAKVVPENEIEKLEKLRKRIAEFVDVIGFE